MSDDQDYSSFQARHPKALSGRFWSFDRGDVVLTIAFSPLVAFVIVRFTQLAALLLVGPVFLWVGLMTRHNDGRSYRLALGHLQAFWRKHVRHNRIWTAVADGKKHHLSGVGKSRDSRAIPLRVNTLRATALLHDDERKGDMIAIIGEGSGFIAGGIPSQFNALNALAGELGRVCAVQGFATGVSFIFRRRPLNLTRERQQFDRLIHPDIAVPEALLKMARQEPLTALDVRNLRLHNATLEMLEMAVDYTGDVTMALALNIKREKLLARATARNGSIFSGQLKRLPLSKVSLIALDGLTSWGVANPTILDKDAMHDYLRGAWDVVHLNDYYRGLADPEGFEEPIDPGRFHWPQHYIEEYEGYCVMDDTYHAVIRLTGFPEWFLPGMLQELYSNSKVPWRSLALVGDVVSSRREVNTLNYFIPLLESMDESRQIVYKSTAKQDREDSLRAREAHATRAGYTQSYMGFAAVSGGSKDEIDDGIDNTFRVIRSISGNLDGVRIMPPNLQVRAAITATTGKNLL